MKLSDRFSLVWNNLRPKLEEIIKLRRERRRSKAREDCIPARKAKIYQFSIGILGDEPYVTFSDVRDLAQVQKHLFEDDIEYEMSCDDLQELARQIRKHNKERKKLVLRQPAAQLAATRVKYGLAEFPANIRIAGGGEEQSDRCSPGRGLAAVTEGVQDITAW